MPGGGVSQLNRELNNISTYHRHEGVGCSDHQAETSAVQLKSSVSSVPVSTESCTRNFTHVNLLQDVDKLREAE